MSDNEFNLIKVDFKSLAKPVQKLIKTMGDLVGAHGRPSIIRRTAEAEADARVIDALSKEKVMEIEDRMLNRVSNREVRRQHNLESITQKSIEFLPDEVSEEKVDDDWKHQFIEYSQDVGDEEMQSLWARILAGEITRPKSYSLRTMNLVNTMNKHDAELFTRFCKFIIDNEMYVKVDADVAFLQSKGISYNNLMHLDTIGLIHFPSDIASIILPKGEKNKKRKWKYFNTNFHIALKEPFDEIRVPVVPLTTIGCELSYIAGAESDDDYKKEIIKRLDTLIINYLIEQT